MTSPVVATSMIHPRSNQLIFQQSTPTHMRLDTDYGNSTASGSIHPTLTPPKIGCSHFKLVDSPTIDSSINQNSTQIKSTSQYRISSNGIDTTTPHMMSTITLKLPRQGALTIVATRLSMHQLLQELLHLTTGPSKIESARSTPLKSTPQ
ncbi:hypothetical protein TIFTF001_028623 [Ficus carica]|uniref:Uncharacterized protein n=1 Tax=Ficus carica TaxID=3494 RepID=A0AA88J223_FICCA|nr:hypothetical protein TIFTF001_028623 [Ficus carica]